MQIYLCVCARERESIRTLILILETKKRGVEREKKNNLVYIIRIILFNLLNIISVQFNNWNKLKGFY